jgi:hypothetical protein
MIFFTWYLMAVMHFHPVCSLWVVSPTAADLAAAGCPAQQYLADYERTMLSDGRTIYEDQMDNEVLCIVTVYHKSEPSATELLDQCSDRMDLITAHEVRGWELYGSFQLETPAPDCTLPAVDNSGSISTDEEYQFLSGRLSWWGINSTTTDWQNRYDETIRGAADVAGIPAALLKSMIAQESQFWPLWTGDLEEVGLMQVTWDGADTALRHDPELFDRYCPQAIDPMRCGGGYDQLLGWEKSRVQTQLINDLRVEGTPLDASVMAANDLWIYAHILRAYACYTQDLYPTAPDLWTATAVVYNTGQACLSADGTVICQQGKTYLEKLR